MYVPIRTPMIPPKRLVPRPTMQYMLNTAPLIPNSALTRGRQALADRVKIGSRIKDIGNRKSERFGPKRNIRMPGKKNPTMSPNRT